MLLVLKTVLHLTLRDTRTSGGYDVRAVHVGIAGLLLLGIWVAGLLAPHVGPVSPDAMRDVAIIALAIVAGLALAFMRR